MTSSVFSVFFLLASLVFCVSAVDPAGVKIRITNQALDMLNLQAQAIIQERLLNRPFETLQYGPCSINALTFTQMNIQQATLRFQQDSGFRFEIQNFGVRINFNQQINAWLFQHTAASQFEVGGVAANIEVSLSRNAQGRLSVAMPQCTATADRIALMNGGISGTVLTGLLDCLRRFFNLLVSLIRLFC
ncbi:phospholipid transfer protein-like, partial [Stegastes partitus]|uniref:Phospholipid transfer protein-like n=1 Tax=Stegastes partitus TaxID=144197 RepID=A0A9Y4N9M4_9TELE